MSGMSLYNASYRHHIISNGLSLAFEPWRNTTLNDVMQLTPLEHIQATLNSLQRNLADQTPEYKEDVRLAKQLYDALKTNRFTFNREPWFCTRDVVRWLAEGTPIARLPQELLLRAKTADGEEIPPGPAVAAFVGLGLAKDLDLFLVPKMLEYGREKGCFPVSVNVSSSAVVSPDFWQQSFTFLREHLKNGGKKTDVVFEVERSALDSEEGLKAIKRVRESGFRFAVDDFYSEDLRPEQIDTIVQHIDFIKFTGEAIQRGIEGKYNLNILVEQARAIGPEKLFVAKWVDNHEQAVRLLKEFKIDAAQGRNLPQNLKIFAADVKKLLT